MKREHIILSGFAGAPELSRATVNGKRVDIKGTQAAYYIACRDIENARKEVKRIYRKSTRAVDNNDYCYGFFERGTRNYYTIKALTFKRTDTIDRRLYCYKELKNHLINNPIEVVTETGYVTPTGASKPTIDKQYVDIDYGKLLKIRLI